MKPLVRDLGIVAFAKIAASCVVLASGFLAVSDDDYARVVIAEQWAHAPKLDPSGTSWLPAPFWLQGAAMLVFGRGLGTARALAFVSGIGAALVVWIAGRWIDDAADGENAGAGARWGSVVGAVLASCLPLAARLGVATVPELPAAALTLLAMASLAGRADDVGAHRRLLGAIAVTAACLSRYEAWPVAIVLAVFSALDATRSRGARRGRLGLSAVVAVAGPSAWLAWNRYAHGDWWAFAGRVAAYRRSLGEGGGGAAALRDYVAGLVRSEPELFVALLLLGVLTLRSPGARARASAYLRPAIGAAVMSIALVLAAARDGAPTHHPERALLAVALLAALAVGTMAAALAGERRGAVALVAGLALVTGFLVRRTTPDEGFAGRRDEEAIGRLAAGTMPAGDRVLVEVRDYGHLAVAAGFGRQEDLIADRDIDPRKPAQPSSFAPGALAKRVGAVGARWLLAASSPEACSQLGRERGRSGAWTLWEVVEDRKSTAP